MTTMTANELRAARKREVALGYRIFGTLGWGDLGDGHISARDPERTDCFWLLRGDVGFKDARVADLVLVGPDGTVVEGGAGTNRPAFFIHWPVLAARPELVSVAHTHTQFGTPFSAEARMLEPITQEACVFFEDHVLFDDEEVQVQRLDCGVRIAAALGANRAAVLRNHGLLTVGASVREAVAWFVMMERVAEAHVKARSPRPISAAAARYAKSDLATDAQADRVFDFLVRHHLGMEPEVDGVRGEDAIRAVGG